MRLITAQNYLNTLSSTSMINKDLKLYAFVDGIGPQFKIKI